MYWNLIESNLIDLSRRYSATPIRMVGFPSAPLSSTRVVSRRRLQEAHGEFESEHPGYCGAQDTFYVRNLKGVGRVYQQTFIDTYAKVACAKLYDRKTPIAADLLNDRVLPFFEEHDVKLLRVRVLWQP